MITCGRGDKEAISTQRYTDRLVWNGLLDSWPNGKPCPDAPPLLPLMLHRHRSIATMEEKEEDVRVCI